MLPKTKPQRSVAEIWAAVPLESQQMILANVYCSHCGHGVRIADFDAEVIGRGLLLSSMCPDCGGKVARHVEEVNP